MPGGAVFPLPLLGGFLGFFVHSAHRFAFRVPRFPRPLAWRRIFGGDLAHRELPWLPCETIGTFAVEALIRKVSV